MDVNRRHQADFRYGKIDVRLTADGQGEDLDSTADSIMTYVMGAAYLELLPELRLLVQAMNDGAGATKVEEYTSIETLGVRCQISVVVDLAHDVGEESLRKVIQATLMAEVADIITDCIIYPDHGTRATTTRVSASVLPLVLRADELRSMGDIAKRLIPDLPDDLVEFLNEVGASQADRLGTSSERRGLLSRLRS